MKYEEAVRIFGESLVRKNIFVEPTEIAEGWFFDSHSSNYQVDAIRFCAKKRLRITNTFNNTYDIMRTLIKCKCPYCGRATKVVGGSGSDGEQTSTYKCNKCKAEIYLTIAHGSYVTKAQEEN